MQKLFIPTILALLLAQGSFASWPQFLGPDRNGIADEKTTIRIPGETEEFATLWKIKVGAGRAGPVVSGNKVLLHHRIDNEEILDALDVETGKTLWRSSHACTYVDSYGMDPGPKSTPTIIDGKVYTYGIQGLLACTDFETGKNIWKVDTLKQYQSKKGFFGRCSSPLVENGLVLLNLGGRHQGKGAGVAAFKVDSGKLVWHATDHEGSYASPIATTINGKRTAIFFTREGLVGATLGKPGTVPSLLFQNHYRPAMHASVNAASAISFGGNKVFASTCYRVGATVWEVGKDGKLSQVWKAQDAMDCHFSTPVMYKGRLYGMHGRQEDGMQARCIEPGTGKVLWTSGRMDSGCLLVADGKLVILLESGELIIADAQRGGYKELSRRQVLGKGRSYPAISGGRLYARDERNMIALKLN